jgi:hypothetical protein
MKKIPYNTFGPPVPTGQTSARTFSVPERLAKGRDEFVANQNNTRIVWRLWAWQVARQRPRG